MIYEHIALLLFKHYILTNNLFTIYKPLQMPSDTALLKEKAVAEILEETKRAAIRAEVWSFLCHICLIFKYALLLSFAGRRFSSMEEDPERKCEQEIFE